MPTEPNQPADPAACLAEMQFVAWKMNLTTPVQADVLYVKGQLAEWMSEDDPIPPDPPPNPFPDPEPPPPPPTPCYPLADAIEWVKSLDTMTNGGRYDVASAEWQSWATNGPFAST